MGHAESLNVSFPERERFDALLASGRGALLIGAHVGNLEMTRALAAGRRLATVNAVVYSEHSPAFRALLAAESADYAVNLIHVAQIGPETVLDLRDKIERGELLVIVGDRTPPAQNGRVCTVEFLGAPAAFAQGPYVLAALLECPVYLFFCLREEGGYRIYFEPFAERVVLPRQEREAALLGYAQRYARRLEQLCLHSPYQWFNFYNYWQHQ
jgi:predicted LPLAT superfamily acyltransferase